MALVIVQCFYAVYVLYVADINNTIKHLYPVLPLCTTMHV